MRQHRKQDYTQAKTVAATNAVAHFVATAPHAGHEVRSAKGVANGYASLDETAKVPTSQIQDIYELTENKGEADGYASLDSDGLIPLEQLPVSEITLDELGAPSDNTDLNASTTAHGLLPRLSGAESDVLRGDGTWGPVVQFSDDVREFSDDVRSKD